MILSLVRRFSCQEEGKAIEKMVLDHAPSTTASSFGPGVAISNESLRINQTRRADSPVQSSPFPSVWRPGQENTHTYPPYDVWRPGQENPQTVLPDDGISSVVNTSNNGVHSPLQEKKSDPLAPRPETRRLGYFSVAALIINRMIGGYF